MQSQAPKKALLTALGTLIALSSPVLAQVSSYPDMAVEQCLAEGAIAKIKGGNLVGATRPRKVAIECSIGLDAAVFKDIDIHRRGLPAKPGAIPEMNFSDSYKYERAAYLLDRELGMNMVPVAVIRQHKANEGVLVEWIDNATHESHLARALSGSEIAALAQRKSVMRLFDALILNVDRRQENWLVDRDTLDLYLIDHSRSFRERMTLPPECAAQLWRVSRSLYDRLTALEEARLTELLADLVSRQQIRALLARRDLILEKIDRDVRNHGPQVVFTDGQGPQVSGKVAASDLGKDQ